MFVLSIKTGYIIVEGNLAEGYSVEELGKTCVSKTEKEKAGYRLTINGSERWVEKVKIGDIALKKYNSEMENYIKHNSVSEKGKRPFSTKKVHLSAPFQPIWLYPEKQEDILLSDLDFQSDIAYSQVGFIPFDGEIIPVFNVSSVDELYWYDLFRLRAAGLRIKQCEDCGCAFVAKTTAIRCESCRKAGKGEEKKQTNLKSDPARKLKKGILNRSAKGKRPYIHENYLNDLARKIDAAQEGDRLPNGEYIRLLKQWDLWDRIYYKLCRYFREENDAVTDYDLQEKWKSVYSNFPQTDNPEKWLSDWCEKTHIEMK